MRAYADRWHRTDALYFEDLTKDELQISIDVSRVRSQIEYCCIQTQSTCDRPVETLGTSGTKYERSMSVSADVSTLFWATNH